ESTYSPSFSFFFSRVAAHPDLHSFPTRRSSDLSLTAGNARSPQHWQLRARGQLRRRPGLRVLPAGAGAERTDPAGCRRPDAGRRDRKSTRLNSSHLVISYAVFCLKKKKIIRQTR